MPKEWHQLVSDCLLRFHFPIPPRVGSRPNCGFGCSGLFPVSEGYKLIQNFLQSLEPPFLVGGCSSISPVHLRAVRFTDLGYFFPKFLDTL